LLLERSQSTNRVVPNDTSDVAQLRPLLATALQRDDDIADMASGERGVWKRLVPRIKVPLTTGTQYGADSAANIWASSALAFRMKKGIAFRRPPFEREADSLTFIPVEIVKHRRNTRNERVPIFYLVGRLIALFLIAAPVGGNSVSSRFSTNLDVVLSSKGC
jgi:hypothetical protein